MTTNPAGDTFSPPRDTEQNCQREGEKCSHTDTIPSIVNLEVLIRPLLLHKQRAARRDDLVCELRPTTLSRFGKNHFRRTFPVHLLCDNVEVPRTLLCDREL